ncbi:glycosyltransferase [Pullulanibacillus sp. KACC 23026]|uniref:glycosyltransferase n=1 Tax=Pullulanibacillus sp. KACC 23026 TaxID=3028315 RepID=UPI0023AF5878|nr:glycosyltransferase [Pullulanibacillus sp. KACC 23026]WEG13299.1 glycosyltransferase [Pullulanibacillus sp. KACC 23026]
MTLGSGTIHVIIAPSPWNDDPLTYRRHLLASFLQSLPETKCVYWIAPEVTGRPNALQNSTFNEERLPNGVIQIKVPDFKSFVRYSPLFQKRFASYIDGNLEKATTNYLWYTYPAFSSLTRLNLWTKVIYDCSDRWGEAEQVSQPLMNKLKRRLIFRSEKKVTQSSTRIFTSSEFLKDNLESTYEVDSVLVENGVDLARFMEGNQMPERKQGSPVFGFVGGLKSWKIDFRLLAEAAKAKPDWEFVLIGSATYGDMGSAYKEMTECQNVTVKPAVTYDQIPEAIRGFQVGLLPYLANDYNKGVFPLKFYEYLACGLPIVGTGLPSTIGHVNPGIYEHTDGSLANFLEACERALRFSPTQREKRVALAKEADWTIKLPFIWNQVSKSKLGIYHG